MDWPSEDAGSSATVFVRGLPYTWTDLDLSANFEHIGPVRRSFIVHQKRTTTSKGFGFVQFALHDDALRAVEEMDGKEVGDGRRLRVEMAVERGKEGSVKGKRAGVGEKRKEQTTADSAGAKRQKVDTATIVKEEHSTALQGAQNNEAQAVSSQEDSNDADSETSEDEDEDEEDSRCTASSEANGQPARIIQNKQTMEEDGVKKAKEEQQVNEMDSISMADDQTALTTSHNTPSHALLVSGFPPSTISLDDVLRQHSLHPTLVVFPAPESTLKKKAARLTFPSASLASRAGSLLSSTILPTASAPLRCVALPVNAARLIVRNLPFHIGEPQLRKLLSPYGVIASLLVPVKEQSSGDGGVSRLLNRGFGFVCYVRMEDAAAMMKAVNGRLQWGRRLAVDWSLDKQQYDARVEMAKKKEKLKDMRKEKKKAAKDEGEDEDGGVKVKKEEDEEEDDGAGGDEDVVMVKEEEGAAELSTDMEEDVEEGEDEDEDEAEHDESESDEHGDDEKSSDDEAVAPLSPASSTEASSSSSSISPRTKPSRSVVSTDSDADCTLFIRNLAYETTEQALFDKFSLLGKVKYARIVMERVEGAADTAKRDAKDRDDEGDEKAATTRSKGVAFVRFYNKADSDRVLALCQPATTAAATSSDKRLPSMVSLSEGGIVLDNRQLNIVRAVDKRQASQYSAASAHKLDKRNLYLAREGVILPSSAGAAAVMNEDELKRRERYYREKKRKLDNPNFMVSRVRLSLRNLPLDCDEKQLKRTMMAAVKLGRKEERQREREEMRRADEATNDNKAAEDDEKQKRRREAAMAREAIRRLPIVMRQVKVVRDAERAGASGLGRSKRYGFLEFDQHETALTALARGQCAQ